MYKNEFSSSTLSFVIKTKPRVKNSWFCHAYGHTISFKIIDVTGTIFLVAISGHDWQSILDFETSTEEYPLCNN